jgi:hypothetical protein
MIIPPLVFSSAGAGFTTTLSFIGFIVELIFELILNCDLVKQ